MPSQLKAYEDSGNGIGRNQHNVLGNLRVSNTLHSTQNRVEEDDHHAGVQSGFIVSLQKPRESHANPFHLPDDIGNRTKYQTQHGDHASGIRVIPVADKLGDRKFPVLSEIGCNQHRKDDVAPGPAHQKYRSTIPVVRHPDESGHGDE